MPARKTSGQHHRPSQKPSLPPATDWGTADTDEILKRRLRAREERHGITNLDPNHPIFSNFAVRSPSGMTYQVEVRDLLSRQFSCTCPDFRINGLGTCKHTEAVLLYLARRERAAFKGAQRSHPPVWISFPRGTPCGWNAASAGCPRPYADILTPVAPFFPAPIQGRWSRLPRSPGARPCAFRRRWTRG